MSHAGGDGSHSGVASALAAWTVVPPDRRRLTGSGAASVHSQVVGHTAVACPAAPAVGGPMVITWKEASHKSKCTPARQQCLIRSHRVQQE